MYYGRLLWKKKENEKEKARKCCQMNNEKLKKDCESMIEIFHMKKKLKKRLC